MTQMHLPLAVRMFSPISVRISGLLLAVLSVNLVNSAQSALAQVPTSGSLTVAVTGLKNANGQVCFSLFDRGEGFPDNAEAIVATQCVAAMTAGQTESPAAGDIAPLSVTFDDLEFGAYAVSVIHDENEDNQLNTGTFGIPTEGFGFSQNPAIQLSAPDFSEAAIVVAGRSSSAQIELVYY